MKDQDEYVISNPYGDYAKSLDGLLMEIAFHTGPIFTPRKHTVMTWAKQRRNAKSRRNNLQKHRK